MFLRVGFVDLVVGRVIENRTSVKHREVQPPHLSDGPHCPVTGPTNGRRVSHVMRYLVPAFAVTTSIESAPMRDVRETSVEIGAVAGLNTWRASRSQLYRATYSVHTMPAPSASS